MAKLAIVMVVLVTVVFAVDQVIGGECDSYEREKLNEGYYKCVYKDPLGIPTIGVGFNLKKFGAQSEIESVGANYNNVLAGTECLDDGQIERLFNKDMDSAKGCSERFVSSNIGDGPRSAINDMAFNMGCGSLGVFTTFKKDVEQGDYKEAAEDMKASLWCRQVGSRCTRDVDCMKAGITASQESEDNGIL